MEQEVYSGGISVPAAVKLLGEMCDGIRGKENVVHTPNRYVSECNPLSRRYRLKNEGDYHFRLAQIRASRGWLVQHCG